jgi:hypothetical protein
VNCVWIGMSSPNSRNFIIRRGKKAIYIFASSNL